jgi:hypothetical protein
MTIRESVKREIDTLPEAALYSVRDFVLFQKYRAIGETDDAAYLDSIPGMTDSIKQGLETPVSQCMPLTDVWPDV